MTGSRAIDCSFPSASATECRRDFNGFSLVWTQCGRGVYRHSFDRMMVASIFGPASIRLDVSNGCVSANYQFTGQHVSLIPGGVTYTSKWDVPGEIVRWLIGKQVIDRVAYESISQQPIEPSGHCSGRYMVRDPLTEQLSQSVREEFERGVPSVLFAESAMTVLLTHLMRNSAITAKLPPGLERSLSPSQFRKVLDYIEAHLGDDLSLCELADEVGMSAHYFSALFRNRTGLSPYRYITERRIEEAKRLLRRSNLRLVDIALEVGFSSQSRFTEAFTRIAGTTPLTYRKCL